MLPADQRLGTEDLSGSQLHDRLVVEDELPLAQGRLELIRNVGAGRPGGRPTVDAVGGRARFARVLRGAGRVP